MLPVQPAGLAQDPRPPAAARALQGRAGLRDRVGDYRIIYTVQDGVLLVVVVVPLGHRRDLSDQKAQTGLEPDPGGSRETPSGTLRRGSDSRSDAAGAGIHVPPVVPLVPR